MKDDEYKALRWLLGRGTHTETVYTVDGRRIEQHIGEIGGRAALVRVLRSSSPSLDVLNELANLFEPVAVAGPELWLELVLRRGRGRPRNDVETSVKKIKRAKAIRAEEEIGSKPYIAVETVAKEKGLARSTMYEAKKATKRAKAVREGKN
jgi:hypothetical protein